MEQKKPRRIWKTSRNARFRLQNNTINNTHHFESNIRTTFNKTNVNFRFRSGLGCQKALFKIRPSTQGMDLIIERDMKGALNNKKNDSTPINLYNKGPLEEDDSITRQFELSENDKIVDDFNYDE